MCLIESGYLVLGILCSMYKDSRIERLIALFGPWKNSIGDITKSTTSDRALSVGMGIVQTRDPYLTF